MISTSYNYRMIEFDTPITFETIKVIIRDEKISGADLTHIINDVHKHYEIASRLTKYNKPGDYYRDLLSQLIKTYGH